MPTDRIEELRALRKLERVVHDGGELLSWANAADTLRGALYDDCDALLDCAEALRDLLMDTQHANHECDDEVYCPVKNAEEALARLNGDDHD